MISLAHLKIIFPEPSSWRQQYDEIPQYASSYVEDYLGINLEEK
jgi:hypothetical protein